jgi:sugar phosphate isomerase/epimerase
MMHIPSIARGNSEEQIAEAWKRVDALRKSLDELMPVCEELGVPLALENMPLDTFEVLEKIFTEYPAKLLGLCYDAGHGNIDWKDGTTANGMECLERNLDRLQALHFHDNDGSGDKHQPPMYGTIDWKRLCDNVRKSAYPRCFSFEMSEGNTPFKDKHIEFLKDAYERCEKAISL